MAITADGVSIDSKIETKTVVELLDKLGKISHTDQRIGGISTGNPRTSLYI